MSKSKETPKRNNWTLRLVGSLFLNPVSGLIVWLLFRNNEAKQVFIGSLFTVFGLFLLWTVKTLIALIVLLARGLFWLVKSLFSLVI